MKPTIRTLSMLFGVVACLLLGGFEAKADSQTLELEHIVPLPDGGEIVAYDPEAQTLLVTGTSTIRAFAYTPGGEAAPKPTATYDLSEAFTPRDTLRDISSVAVDPLGRGFFAATVIPSDNGKRRGRVLVYALDGGTTLASIEVGFHPDSLLFTADGSTIVVINEGEFTVPEAGGGGDRDAPGSIALIDVTLRDGAPSFRFAGDFPLVWHAIEPGVTLDGLRINDATASEAAWYRHAEPEYAAVVGNRVVVGFQENNALGVFHLRRKRWSAIASLGVRPMTVDADDADGGAAIDDDVFGLPMPDTLVAFPDPRDARRTLIATADEGDFRVDDGDRRRAGAFDNGGDEAWRGVRRLRVSVPDSDLDGDGQIDRAVAAGTRGVSIWQTPTRGNAPAQRVGHTGSLEAFLLDQDPDRHNLNSKSAPTAADADAPNSEDTVDARSDDKGPEPEGLAVLTPETLGLDPNTEAAPTYLLVALERQNGLVLIDASDPATPTPVAYRNDLPQLAAPECVLPIPAALDAAYDNDGQRHARVIVAYEGDEAGQRIGLGVYRVVLDPEP